MTATDLALTDSAHRDMTIPVPGAATDATAVDLVVWAERLSVAHRLASAICMTSFAPAHFRGKPDEGAIAIMYGAELGFTPTQAIQNIFVIGGRPGMYARQMAALVMSRGHRIWTVEKTDTAVTVAGVRRGSGNTEEVETWTIERARKAGYTSNKKYDTDPQSMLYARAVGDVCRRIAPDVLAGLAYTVEELEAIPGELVPAPAERSATARMRARMGQSLNHTPGTVDDVQDVAVEPDSETGEAITDAQRRAIFQAFNAAGFTSNERTDEGRKPRLAYMSQVLGRPVDSTKDLTIRDASLVLNALRADADDALAAASSAGEPA